jgi:Inner membrane protein YgaP-like, transmembrane domain
MLNVGAADRIVRIIIGLAVLALVFVGPRTPWGWVGLLPLATGVMGWCPLYSVLKVRTRPRPA